MQHWRLSTKAVSMVLCWMLTLGLVRRTASGCLSASVTLAAAFVLLLSRADPACMTVDIGKPRRIGSVRIGHSTKSVTAKLTSCPASYNLAKYHMSHYIVVDDRELDRQSLSMTLNVVSPDCSIGEADGINQMYARLA